MISKLFVAFAALYALLSQPGSCAPEPGLRSLLGGFVPEPPAFCKYNLYEEFSYGGGIWIYEINIPGMPDRFCNYEFMETIATVCKGEIRQPNLFGWQAMHEPGRGRDGKQCRGRIKATGRTDMFNPDCPERALACALQQLQIDVPVPAECMEIKREEYSARAKADFYE